MNVKILIVTFTAIGISVASVIGLICRKKNTRFY